MTSSFDKVWRATLTCLSIVTVCHQEKAGYMVRSMRFILTYKVSTANAETIQLWQVRRGD